MFDSRAVKQTAKDKLKKHYWIFVIACFLALVSGIDYTLSLDVTKQAVIDIDHVLNSSNSEQKTAEDADLTKYGPWDVYYKIIAGNLDKSKAISDEIVKNNKQNPGNYFGKIELAYNDGVFAKVANMITSGNIFLAVFMGIRSIVKNDNAATAIFIIISILAFLFLWACLLNVYKAILRRIFLEGHIYEKISKKTFIHFISVRRYFKAVLTMLVSFSLQFLWWFTIVGGIIKYFSYFLVPYIVAENPDISPLNAVNLSRRMMKGHKVECFKLKFSFIGWYLLNIMTLGGVGIFYFNPYMEAFFTEYYVYLRELAKEKNIDGAELLNDEYLYKKADEQLLSEAYSDVVELSKIPEPQKLPGNKVWRFFANVFGIVPMYSETEQEYFDANVRKSKISDYKNIMSGDSYPERLNPIPAKQKTIKIEFLNFKRHYSICSLVIMFFIFSFIGWFWEVCFHFLEDGTFINRGILHGPWLPIYGSGGILILLLLNKLRARPVLGFIVSIVLCGTVEYLTAVVLEELYHEKWWDYTGYFLNINSRVCAEGLLVFGIAGIIIVYIAAPLLDNILRRARLRYLLPICIILMFTFILDQVYSFYYPNKGDGITNYNIPPAYINSTLP